MSDQNIEERILERIERLEKALGLIQDDVGRKILQVVEIARRLEDSQKDSFESYRRTVDSLSLKLKDIQVQINQLDHLICP